MLISLVPLLSYKRCEIKTQIYAHSTIKFVIPSNYAFSLVHVITYNKFQQ